jgi:hypothetical protein
VKYIEFKKQMKKACFTIEEARLVAWKTVPSVLKLQLHQWCLHQNLCRIKRGVYCFTDRITDKMQIINSLYGPAYVSLESALNHYGLIPDVPFSLTLVTPRMTKRYNTPYGQFIFHKIKTQLFWGYDPLTLMGDKEKVVLDYCYLNASRLEPNHECWDAVRWQNLNNLNFKRLIGYANKAKHHKVSALIHSLHSYSKSDAKS